MSMAYIRETYGVPAKRGALIAFSGHYYRIVGSKGHYLRVRPSPGMASSTIHPTWRVTYQPTSSCEAK